MLLVFILTGCVDNEEVNKQEGEIKKETKLLRPEKAEKIELELSGSFKELREKYPNIKLELPNTINIFIP